METLCLGIMDRLRESTRDLHNSAEKHEFQQLLIKGTISGGDYAGYLSQMLLVHSALEGRLLDVAAQPPFNAVIRPHHFRESMLRSDLAELGVNPDDATPLPSTQKFIDQIEEATRANPVALLGYLYVLEGSTNGSQFIARSVSRLFGPDRKCPVAYLNPHGENQRERWMAFKRDMSAVTLSDHECELILRAASETFSAMINLSDDLMAYSGDTDQS